MKSLNQLLGAILLSILSMPFIILASLSRGLNFIELLYRGKNMDAIFSVLFFPLTALLTTLIGLLFTTFQGWDIGLIAFMTTIPKRVLYFFKKQLFFGLEKNESIRDIFINPQAPAGLDDFIKPNFIGRSTLKLLSLCLLMEYYLAYDAKTVSPHNDVSLYFTEKNLTILKKMYAHIELNQSANITSDIAQYLSKKHQEALLALKITDQLALTDDTRAGKQQSAQDELAIIETAKRCLEHFQNNPKIALDLNEPAQSTPQKTLNYIWLAIHNECPHEQDRTKLKEKLTLTLFQIQRGFNIVHNGSGPDMPECPTGAMGLLVRVLCDEQEKMPHALYEAADPTPANLSLALKNTLDRPFQSTYSSISKAAQQSYAKNPKTYKEEQKKVIMQSWKFNFKPLFEEGVLQEDSLQRIIDSGTDAWEPPGLSKYN